MQHRCRTASSCPSSCSGSWQRSCSGSCASSPAAARGKACQTWHATCSHSLDPHQCQTSSTAGHHGLLHIPGTCLLQYNETICPGEDISFFYLGALHSSWQSYLRLWQLQSLLDRALEYCRRSFYITFTVDAPYSGSQPLFILSLQLAIMSLHFQVLAQTLLLHSIWL